MLVRYVYMCALGRQGRASPFLTRHAYLETRFCALLLHEPGRADQGTEARTRGRQGAGGRAGYRVLVVEDDYYLAGDTAAALRGAAEARVSGSQTFSRARVYDEEDVQLGVGYCSRTWANQDAGRPVEPEMTWRRSGRGGDGESRCQLSGWQPKSASGAWPTSANLACEASQSRAAARASCPADAVA